MVSKPAQQQLHRGVRLTEMLKQGLNVPLNVEDQVVIIFLGHPVLKRVLDIKWELFAAREYYTHLQWYILMLMAMINVVVSLQDTEILFKNYKDNDTVWIQPGFAIGVFSMIFFIFGNYYLRYLEPERFLELTC
ncbi:hypothetical protein THRCLA_09720 [Thraustotheca clavata]|uniref:ATP synthase alpha subunit C-terminal domain-containing protein n=1 Tax=Thraustotheca clavata TaxID=74557 RepID=A0A1V9YUM3_9STRA|nr:hypothetical protein THRCLA_09720 [Thraustotheca clavata]